MTLHRAMRWPLCRIATMSARGSSGLALVLVSLGMLAGTANAAPAEFPAPSGLADPVVLLARIQQASRNLDYSGVFMYSQGEFGQSSRVVHVVDGSGERERLEVLDGPAREYLRHNDEVQCLMPERRTIRLEKRRSDRFPGLLVGDPAGLAAHYAITTEPTLHRVAGRECQVISIEPRDKLRYGYKLCADSQTHLLLKAQTLTATHSVVEQVVFTSLRLGEEVQPAMLTSRWNTRDWKTLQLTMTPVDLAAKGWRIAPPAGFVKVMEVGRTMPQGEAVSQILISDGLAGISVFIEPFDSKHNSHRQHGGARRGSFNVFSARVADFWLTALGEVPMTTLQQLAESVEYVPLAATK